MSDELKRTVIALQKKIDELKQTDNDLSVDLGFQTKEKERLLRECKQLGIKDEDPETVSKRIKALEAKINEEASSLLATINTLERQDWG